MHIPQGPTATLALELFDDALAAALRPSPDYDVSRWLYVPNHYSEYRYILGTRGPEAPDLHRHQPLHRRAGRPGPHPPVRPADRAFQRVRQLFDVQRLRPAGHPADDMERSCNPVLHAENRRAFRYLLSLSPAPALWAAWGNIIEKRGYLMVVCGTLPPTPAPPGPSGSPPAPC